jgi:hypothetical protein
MPVVVSRLRDAGRAVQFWRCMNISAICGTLENMRQLRFAQDDFSIDDIKSFLGF